MESVIVEFVLLSPFNKRKMCGRIDYYLSSFSVLHGGKNTKLWSEKTLYRSPDIAFLLLSILDGIAQKTINRDFISADPNLEERYCHYWSEVSLSEHEISIAIPFQNLHNEPFWNLSKKHGVQVESILPTRIELNGYYYGATIDHDLFILLQMEPSRRRIRETILQSNFSSALAAEYWEPAIQRINR